MVTPSWELEVTPGGDKVILEGTVQEVHADLLKLNPNWDDDFFNKSSSSHLHKRTYFDASDEHYCGGMFPVVNYEYNWAIKDGISYLRGLGGVPTAPTRPGWCSRVSCSYDAAIIWCNDVREQYPFCPPISPLSIAKIPLCWLIRRRIPLESRCIRLEVSQMVLNSF